MAQLIGIALHLLHRDEETEAQKLLAEPNHMAAEGWAEQHGLSDSAYLVVYVQSHLLCPFGAVGPCESVNTMRLLLSSQGCGEGCNEAVVTCMNFLLCPTQDTKKGHIL